MTQLLRRSVAITAAMIQCVTVLTASGQDDSTTFPAKLKTLLESRCLSCHNDLDHKGDFSLQSRTAAFRDGYIDTDEPLNSHLLTVVMSQGDAAPQMPGDGSPLSREEVRLIAEWIESGAGWPEQLTLSDPIIQDFDWWSLRPVVRPPVPKARTNAAADFSIRSPIDSFVQLQQIKRGLTPSPQADRRTLIRRLTYDLTGLPPTFQEISAFINDKRADAYQQLVERLLASPQYGERWGRHWLDVVKYADTCGYDKDKLRPNAWPYRDYVIQSFNDDKPYARFVQEQIAGDVLYPGEPDGILGLGFIAAGPWDFIGHVEVPESKLDGKVARNLDRDDMVGNTLNTFCSITIQCARCHNHKFDPFTQEHYYSLQSVFAAVDRAERVFNADPAVEKSRQELSATKSKLQAALKAFDDNIKQQGGERLTKLESEIEQLKATSKPPTKQPEFGYHSQISSKPNDIKWLTIDLQRNLALSKIVLHPCHDDYAGIGAGFGFPVRFQVEIASDAVDGSYSTVADFSESDYPNPGLTAVSIAIDSPAETTARFVRITASRLAERKDDFIFALAEVEVFDTSGANAAANANVTAKDSIEAPARWRRANLTDGIWAKAADEKTESNLRIAQQLRSQILAEILTPEKITERQQLLQQHDDLAKQLRQLPQGKMVYAAATQFAVQGNFKPTKGVPRTVSILHRGNIQQPKAEVRPGAIPLSADSKWSHWQLELPEQHTEGDRRAALARWITAYDHPLTWRSIANRIWQYHFGKGLVASPNDFGRMGMRPTHPELLDWLADEFRTTQSFKHLHRLIVNSTTYRQQSGFHAANEAIDSNNQFLWKMNRRRLSAEEVRDSVLAVSGCLNLEPGGPGFYLFELEKPEHSPHFQYHKFDPANKASHRRSIYRFIVRSQPDPFMTTLDCADSSQSTPVRTETLTSLQALSLFNNKFTLTMAEKFAERVAAEASEPGRAAHAFQLTTGRAPERGELVSLETYARKHGLTNLCRVLLNASEFVFVD